MEQTAVGPVVRAGDHARDGLQPGSCPPADLGDRLQQRLGVGVLGIMKERAHICHLGHPAQVHDDNPLGDLGDDAEVMGDHDDAHACLLLEPRHQLQYLRLGGHVQGRGRLVGDQQAGLAGESHGDHGSLAHAAAELVRIGVGLSFGLGHADMTQQLNGLIRALLACSASCAGRAPR